MIKLLGSIYSSIVSRNRLLDKIRFYSAIRFATRLTANIVLPIYFVLTRNKPQYKLDETEKKDGRLIVSLTSFPKRIHRLWLVVESILRQTQKPDAIIVWLSKEQFPVMESLPDSLLRLRKRGLKIELRDGDLRSHKKYFYSIKEYPEDFIITVDDDIYYHNTMIAELVNLSNSYPQTICCHYAAYVGYDSERLLLPYSDWIRIKSQTRPSFDILAGSGGGTLYPPHSLHSEVLNDKVFMHICGHADDVWLYCMSILNRTPTVKSSYPSMPLPIIYSNNYKLAYYNRHNSGNDAQMQSVRNYIKMHYAIDPFE
jgi:hypothetical protein